MYGKQEEILAYLEYCADKYEIEPHIRFNTGVSAASFGESSGVWTLQLSDGTTTRARVVVSGTGGLSRPSLPNINGIDEFEGADAHLGEPHRRPEDCAVGGGVAAVEFEPAQIDA